MKNTQLKSLILVATLALSASPLAMAHNHMSNNMAKNKNMHGSMMGCGGMGMMQGNMMQGNMMFSQLNLTPEQQQEIQSIMANSMTNMQGMQGMQGGMSAHMASMLALMIAPEFDEKQAKAMIGMKQSAMVENKVNMLRARHATFQVLTEEQKIKLQGLMSQQMGMMH